MLPLAVPLSYRAQSTSCRAGQILTQNLPLIYSQLHFLQFFPISPLFANRASIVRPVRASGAALCALFHQYPHPVRPAAEQLASVATLLSRYNASA